MNFTSTECIFDVSLVEDSLIVVESLSKFQNEAPWADAPPYPEQKWLEVIQGVFFVCFFCLPARKFAFHFAGGHLLKQEEFTSQ